MFLIRLIHLKSIRNNNRLIDENNNLNQNIEEASQYQKKKMKIYLE